MSPVDFVLPDHTGADFDVSGLRGRRWILFFYPAAMTPGCTTEAGDFRDEYRAFVDAGYEIVGISPDPPERNARFREEGGFPYRLLSDVDHRVAETFGAWGVKKNYGREYVGLIRSTFVIGPDGEIEREYRNVRATGHVGRLVGELLDPDS